MNRTTHKNFNYHSYLRGIDSKNIFLVAADYLRFMALINICNKKKTPRLSILLEKNSLNELSNYNKEKEFFVHVNEYILMPNHFHISTLEKKTNNLGKFMQRILNSYTKYFNTKYKRKGHLFESKYNQKLIENDVYLEILRDYIIKNPLKLLDISYKHIDYLNGSKKITEKEQEFLDNYPYKYTSNV